MPVRPLKIKKSKLSDDLYNFLIMGISLDGFVNYEDTPIEEIKTLWDIHKEEVLKRFRNFKMQRGLPVYPIWAEKEFEGK